MAEEKRQKAASPPPPEPPILYTDNIIMRTNEDGLVLDVCQRKATSDRFSVIARLGMSRVHAKKFVAKLGRLLAITEGNTQTTGKIKN